MSKNPRGLRATAVAAAVLVLFGAGAMAQADNLDEILAQKSELEQQRADNEAEQEQLAAELEGTDVDLQEIYLEINRLDGEIPIAEQELAQAEADLAAAERELDSVNDRLEIAENEAAQLETEIADSEAAIEQTQDDIGELARSTYRGSDQLSTIAVVVDASSPEDFTDTAFAVNSAMRSQGQVLDDLETSAAQQRNSQARLDAVNVRIGELQVEAEDAVVAADAARVEAQDRKDSLEALRDERAGRATELEGYKVQIETQQESISADNSAIASQIQELADAEADERAKIAEEKRKAEEEAAAKAAQEQQQNNSGSSSSGGSSSGGSGTSGGGAVVDSSTGLISPVPTPFHVTSPFGMRIYPITGGRYMHNGSDIRSSCGNPQVSAQSGTVIAVRGAAGNGTHGNQVLVNHGVLGDGNSYVTVYNHLSRFAVSYGQSVDRGQTIAYTGATGKVTGCHVHVEVWRNGTAIDPESLPGWTRSN